VAPGRGSAAASAKSGAFEIGEKGCEMDIGFIGVGTMGQHMATNLQRAGHDLVVYDIRREAAEKHLEAGAVWADNPAVLAARVDVVFTSLPAPADVELVALGDNGILEGIRAGSVWFDLSTNSPAVVRSLHKTFAERGVAMLDAPVSGGPRGAETGMLALWVGGDRAVFDQYKPVLDAIGDEPYYVGEIGAGTIAKLVHNCAGYAIQTALAEVMTMGVKAGVDPMTLFKAIRNGATGRRRTFDRLAEGFLPGVFDPPSFALRLAHKDVRLATEVGREYNVPMPVCNLAFAEMTEALNRGWGHLDSRVPMLLQEERAGIEPIKIPMNEVQAALQA
jgi:3-hydroxyisobutyrate dehydrogenase-like beta-hydroxyacid dehydrogenase